MLNVNQSKASMHGDGPLLVVAGAGSGKTRVLTTRIKNLLENGAEARNIVAVTFTNKAAREMKERLIGLGISQQAVKEMWAGTFHSICCRILRVHIEEYRDEKGRKWTKNFMIADDGDSKKLIETIVTKTMGLSKTFFDPKDVKSKISQLKNLGLSASEWTEKAREYRDKVIGEVYDLYQQELSKNNSLDFDDLILVTVRLLQSNHSISTEYYENFRHVLVDEYQDTNRVQYELLQQWVTNGARKREWDWHNRSIFAVGDADQSIYGFRMADFTILMDFQRDFGDGLPDDQTQTMIKLEENYRSQANILTAANTLIENNSNRIKKVLLPTKGQGEPIAYRWNNDDLEEAEFVCNQIQRLALGDSSLDWGSFAILYRTSSQSRVIEQRLIKLNIPYTIVGGLKFYDRKEIKDAIAYLKVVVNPSNGMSLNRILNLAKGVGKKTIDKLTTLANERQSDLWDVVNHPLLVTKHAGRSAKGINELATVIRYLHGAKDKLPPLDILKTALDDSGYFKLIYEDEEAETRLGNLQELYNAIARFSEQEDGTLTRFLEEVALSSEGDDDKEDKDKVTLMTIHASKGLEFPVVFLVGMEQGLLPHIKALESDFEDDIEEERRLCYVGITRAKEKLFLSSARTRMLWGQVKYQKESQFLAELG